MDGVDVVAMRINPTTPHISILGHHSCTFTPELRAACFTLQSPSENELHLAQTVSVALAQLYAEAINTLCAQLDLTAQDIHAVGVHGQTIRHRPELGFTVQLNQPAIIAERTGITVVSDFRARDIAAGGQGAPLVPAFHDALWRSPHHNRVVLNIGGFANISVLNQNAITFGFDTGPGNVLMDAWIQRHLGHEYDQNGAWASTGTASNTLLNHLLSDAYFATPHPKSTGRDHFNLTWLDAHLTQHPQLLTQLQPQDIQATLLQLTATTIAQAIIQVAPQCHETIVAGGGAFNTKLCAEIEHQLNTHYTHRHQLTTSATHHIHPSALEGAAFAWLAYRTTQSLSGNLPSTTGAKGPRILGNITPA